CVRGGVHLPGPEVRRDRDPGGDGRSRGLAVHRDPGRRPAGRRRDGRHHRRTRVGAEAGGSQCPEVLNRTDALNAPNAPTRTDPHRRSHPVPHPALVLLNARLLDPALGTFLPHTALAAADGLIAALGDDRTVRALAGPATTVVDLRGAVVTPGFVDGHI